MIAFSVLLIPVGIIVFVVSLMRSGNTEEFPKKIRTTYMYKVMIIALLITISGLVGTWINAVNLAMPNSGASVFALNQSRIGLFTSIATVVVGGAVFVIHGKMVKKS